MRMVAVKTAQVSSAAHSPCIFLDERIGLVGLRVCCVEFFEELALPASGTTIARGVRSLDKGATCDNTAAADRDHALIGASD